MVRVPKALEISHLPLLALVPRSTRAVTDLEQFSSSFFARFEGVTGNAKKAAEREMLEQVQRWLELQRLAVGGQDRG